MTRIKQINEEAEAYSRRLHKINTEYTEEALYTEEAFRSGALWMCNQLIDNACSRRSVLFQGFGSSQRAWFCSHCS